VGLLCALGAAGDLVHLKNGRLLKGTVVEETETAVVVDVGAGRITVARKRIRAIERGAWEREPARQVLQRDEWFLVLHRSRLVGWRRVIHTEGPERVHAEERTVFFRPGGGDDVDIRRVEVADRKGRPIEFLLSETYGKQTDMVTGHVEGKTRVNIRIRRRGKLTLKQLEMPAGWTFALPAWSGFLRGSKPGESRTITALDLYKLRPVELVLRREADSAVGTTPARAITLAGDFRPARALYVPGRGSLTVHLNGDTLIARRTTRERVALARRVHAAPEPLSLEDAVVYPFIRREPELDSIHVQAGVKLTAPDAGWVPRHYDRARGLALSFEKIGIFASLDVFAYPLPGIDGDVDACLKNAMARLKLTADELVPDGEARRTVLCGMPARILRLRGTHRGEPLRCLAAVVRAKNRYLLLVGASPARRWRWARPDFERFLASLDVVP